jgi:hypothetical protein
VGWWPAGKLKQGGFQFGVVGRKRLTRAALSTAVSVNRHGSSEEGSGLPVGMPTSSGVHRRSLRRRRCGWVVGRGGQHQRGVHNDSVVQSKSGGVVEAWRQKGKGGKPSALHALFKAARGGGRRRNREGNGGWEIATTPWSGRHRRGMGTDVRTGPLTCRPHAVSLFPNYPNRLKLVKSKWMPYIAPKFAKFCLRLDWSVLNSFPNGTYVKNLGIDLIFESSMDFKGVQTI